MKCALAEPDGIRSCLTCGRTCIASGTDRRKRASRRAFERLSTATVTFASFLEIRGIRQFAQTAKKEAEEILFIRWNGPFNASIRIAASNK